MPQIFWSLGWCSGGLPTLSIRRLLDGEIEQQKDCLRAKGCAIALDRFFFCFAVIVPDYEIGSLGKTVLLLKMAFAVVPATLIHTL
jgi:hypothetical protein